MGGGQGHHTMNTFTEYGSKAPCILEQDGCHWSVSDHRKEPAVPIGSRAVLDRVRAKINIPPHTRN